VWTISKQLLIFRRFNLDESFVRAVTVLLNPHFAVNGDQLEAGLTLETPVLACPADEWFVDALDALVIAHGDLLEIQNYHQLSFATRQN
jgi:hypothetical protein